MLDFSAAQAFGLLYPCYMLGKVDRALIRRITLRACFSVLCVCALLVLTQDFQIFPLLARKLFHAPLPPSPPDIDTLKTLSSDGTSVLVWRLRTSEPQPRVALIFHGNGEVVGSFEPMQRWLASQGITTYSMEFRGYDDSAYGWPSEQGLYADAEASFEFMLREEKIEPRQAIVLGSSMGTGLASHLAARYHPRVLVLLSPYTSLVDVVRGHPLLGYLSPFVRYEFPTELNIQKLRSTCVIAAHGRRDTIIPFEHSERLQRAYRGDGTFTLLDSNEAGHNDIIGAVRQRLPGAILSCLHKPSLPLS